MKPAIFADTVDWLAQSDAVPACTMKCSGLGMPGLDFDQRMLSCQSSVQGNALRLDQTMQAYVGWLLRWWRRWITWALCDTSVVV